MPVQKVPMRGKKTVKATHDPQSGSGCPQPSETRCEDTQPYPEMVQEKGERASLNDYSLDLRFFGVEVRIQSGLSGCTEAMKRTYQRFVVPQPSSEVPIVDVGTSAGPGNPCHAIQF